MAVAGWPVIRWGGTLGKHLGDFAVGATVHCKFNTYRPSTGAVFTLAGTPAVAVYKDSGATEDTDGVTLSVDFDSRTGLHHLAIDTSADATFYSAGGHFEAVLTAGTVDGVSVAGTTVASFTLAKANVASLSANTITAASIAPDAITAGKIAPGAIDAATFAVDTGFSIIRTGTAQAGGSTSITLDAGASAVTDFYAGDIVVLASGAGAGQARQVSAYNGTTKVATVSAWAVNPDNTTGFVIQPFVAIAGGGGGGLDAAGVRAAVGLASPNLDTQLSGISTKTTNLPSDPADQSLIIAATDAIMTRIGVNGAGLSALPWNAAWDAEIQSECADALVAYDPPTQAEVVTAVNALLTTVLADVYAANGAAPTFQQAIMFIHQRLGQFAHVGTALNVKKLNGSDNAAVITLDSASAPTSSART